MSEVTSGVVRTRKTSLHRGTCHCPLCMADFFEWCRNMENLSALPPISTEEVK
jgi:hypothetical protein